MKGEDVRTQKKLVDENDDRHEDKKLQGCVEDPLEKAEDAADDPLAVFPENRFRDESEQKVEDEGEDDEKDEKEDSDQRIVAERTGEGIADVRVEIKRTRNEESSEERRENVCADF